MEIVFPAMVAVSVAAGLLGGGFGAGVCAAAKVAAARIVALMKISFMGGLLWDVEYMRWLDVPDGMIVA
jgi:hypothetical protein